MALRESRASGGYYVCIREVEKGSKKWLKRLTLERNMNQTVPGSRTEGENAQQGAYSP